MTLNYANILRAILGNNPNPYMSLDIPNGLRNEYNNLRNRWDKFQAEHFPNQYNNMLYYIPDVNDEGANALTNTIYNRY